MRDKQELPAEQMGSGGAAAAQDEKRETKDEERRTKLVPHLWNESNPEQKTEDRGQKAESTSVIRHLSSVIRPPYWGKLSLLQMSLIGVISLFAGLLIYSLVAQEPAPDTRSAILDTQTSIEHLESSPDVSGEEQPPSVDNSAGKAEAVSLQLAESYYAAKDYDAAYYVFDRLRQSHNTPDSKLVRDFLQLRMAFCLKLKGDADKSNQLFRTISQSRSPVLQAIANEQVAFWEMDAGQYLRARTRAYKVIAITGALTFDQQWALDLERDCQFLAAEALTRQVLSLCDADKYLPGKLWSRTESTDPLTGLDEAKLQAALECGINWLNTGLLAPQIRALEPAWHGLPPTGRGEDTAKMAVPQTTLQRWMVICNGPGIEELIARLAANGSLDVKWMTQDKGPKTSAVRAQSSVICFVPSAATQQVVTTVTGAAGLLADVNDNVITIIDPTRYSALSEHTQILAEQAIWLWRRLLLSYGDDHRIPNVHFALALLQSQREALPEAITEYKIVANRYSRSALAPYGLLASSRLKTALRDYVGASADLKELIEQYPDSELLGRAHLELAEATMKAGFLEEAGQLYKKTYNLGCSNESKTIAAFGAGKCHYEMRDYESAVKWFQRYFESLEQHGADAGRYEPDDLYTAYLFYGKSHLALGNAQHGLRHLGPACDALQQAAGKARTSDDYVEALTALVEAQIKKQDFISVLGTIENRRGWPFTQEQVTRLDLLKSRILREMGLADKGVRILAERVRYITDPQLKARINLELARCESASRNLESAEKFYTEAIGALEPGELSRQASCELAEVAFSRGRFEQAVSICSQLLEGPVSGQIKEKASAILASAYSKQQQYDKAAQALLTASK